jgi:anti-repressor protein
MMNELIKVTVKDNQQLVSARDLHKGLELKKQFTDWVKQNFDVFIENEDFTFTPRSVNMPNGGTKAVKDYAITVSMAKELAMMSRTKKGKEYRKYFLKLEQAWNSPEMVMKRALEIANKKVEQLKLENQEMKPKALFADSVAASHTTILIGELAKILRGNGIDIGANRLFRWMRDQGYLISRKGTDYNTPTQKSMDLGLFKIKESTVIHSDDSTSIRKTTKVTGKGQQYFINKFMKMKGEETC